MLWYVYVHNQTAVHPFCLSFELAISKWATFQKVLLTRNSSFKDNEYCSLQAFPSTSAGQENQWVFTVRCQNRDRRSRRTYKNPRTHRQNHQCQKNKKTREAQSQLFRDESVLLANTRVLRQRLQHESVAGDKIWLYTLNILDMAGYCRDTHSWCSQNTFIILETQADFVLCCNLLMLCFSFHSNLFPFMLNIFWVELALVFLMPLAESGGHCSRATGRDSRIPAAIELIPWTALHCVLWTSVVLP